MKKKYGDQNGLNESETARNFRERRASRSQSNTGQPDYAKATPGWILAVIVEVTRQGGAVRFGYSRDGGIYVIGVYLAGEMENIYIKESEGLDTKLEELYNDLTGSPPTNDTSRT